jgi:hypothetical protein
MDAALVLKSLNLAIGHLEVNTEKLLVNKEEYRQPRAIDYRDLLRQDKFASSMSAKGWPWNNAVMESFFSTH